MRFILALVLIFSLNVHSQLKLEGKTVGIYISSQGFSYSEYAVIPLGQFVKQHFGKEYIWESLKQEGLIAIGEKMTEEFKSLSGADSVYFVNANIIEAKHIIAADQNNAVISFDSLTADVLFKIDRLSLNRMQKTVMVSRRSQLVAEKSYEYLTSARIRVLGESRPIFTEACLDKTAARTTTALIDIYKNKSSVGRNLSALFSLCWIQFQTGKTGQGCN